MLFGYKMKIPASDFTSNTPVDLLRLWVSIVVVVVVEVVVVVVVDVAEIENRNYMVPWLKEHCTKYSCY